MGDKKKRREASSSSCRGLLARAHKSSFEFDHRLVIQMMTLLPLAWTAFSSVPTGSKRPRASFHNMHSRLELGAFLRAVHSDSFFLLGSAVLCFRFTKDMI